MVEKALQPEALLNFTNHIVRMNPHVDGCSISAEPNYFPQCGRHFSAYSEREGDSITTVTEVEYDYFEALQEAYKKAKTSLSFTAFCNQLVREQMQKSAFTYIGDVPINVPNRVHDRHPEWFLKDWSMGAPPDQYSDKPQVWGFPILNPQALFTGDPKQPLGPAGRMFKR